MEALRGLMGERDALEREMSEIAELLGASNLGGVSGSLLDSEGFPRADVDVHATRTMRHALACLSTDHKELMGRIERDLWAMHAESCASTNAHAAAATNGTARGCGPRDDGAAAPTRAAAPTGASHRDSAFRGMVSGVPPCARADALMGMNGAAQLSDIPATHGCDADACAQAVPFAIIDSVAEAGPAATAGLKVCDELLRFGTVYAGNHDQLRSIARLVERSEGGSIDLFVR